MLAKFLVVKAISIKFRDISSIRLGRQGERGGRERKRARIERREEGKKG